MCNSVCAAKEAVLSEVILASWIQHGIKHAWWCGSLFHLPTHSLWEVPPCWCFTNMLWRLFLMQDKFFSGKCRLFLSLFILQEFPALYWVMFYIKKYICLSHKWNHIHFLCSPFMCQMLVTLWTIHSSRINQCHYTAACVCTLNSINVVTISVDAPGSTTQRSACKI